MKTAKKETKTTTKKEVKQEVQLKEAFVLWKKTAKSGKDYLNGFFVNEDGNKEYLTGFFNTNKKNPKEPDIRVYTSVAEGEESVEVASLWEYISKNEKRYLSGMTNEKEKLVAFYGKTEKAPYIRAYFREETTDDLPF